MTDEELSLRFRTSILTRTLLTPHGSRSHFPQVRSVRLAISFNTFRFFRTFPSDWPSLTDRWLTGGGGDSLRMNATDSTHDGSTPSPRTVRSEDGTHLHIESAPVPSCLSGFIITEFTLSSNKERVWLCSDFHRQVLTIPLNCSYRSRECRSTVK